MDMPDKPDNKEDPTEDATPPFVRLAKSDDPPANTPPVDTPPTDSAPAGNDQAPTQPLPPANEIADVTPIQQPIEEETLHDPSVAPTTPAPATPQHRDQAPAAVDVSPTEPPAAPTPPTPTPRVTFEPTPYHPEAVTQTPEPIVSSQSTGYHRTATPTPADRSNTPPAHFAPTHAPTPPAWQTESQQPYASRPSATRQTLLAVALLLLLAPGVILLAILLPTSAPNIYADLTGNDTSRDQDNDPQSAMLTGTMSTQQANGENAAVDPQLAERDRMAREAARTRLTDLAKRKDPAEQVDQETIAALAEQTRLAKAEKMRREAQAREREKLAKERERKKLARLQEINDAIKRNLQSLKECRIPSRNKYVELVNIHQPAYDNAPGDLKPTFQAGIDACKQAIRDYQQSEIEILTLLADRRDLEPDEFDSQLLRISQDQAVDKVQRDIAQELIETLGNMPKDKDARTLYFQQVAYDPETASGDKQ